MYFNAMELVAFLFLSLLECFLITTTAITKNTMFVYIGGSRKGKINHANKRSHAPAS